MTVRNRSRRVARTLIGTEESLAATLVSSKFLSKRIIAKGEPAILAGFSAPC